jgi:hypothetical protein
MVLMPVGIREIEVPASCLVDAQGTQSIVGPSDASPAQGMRPSIKPGAFVCRDSRTLPLYGAMDEAPAGLYLGLLHGRDHAEADMDGLGYPGPAIGPLCDVRTAYAAHLYLRFNNPKSFKLFFPRAAAATAKRPVVGGRREAVIDVVDGTIPYDGRYFGDWVVFNHYNE